MDKGFLHGFLILDFKKALDGIDHTINLIEKLMSNGSGGNTLLQSESVMRNLNYLILRHSRA